MPKLRAALLLALLAAAPAALPAQAALDDDAAPLNLLSVGVAGSQGSGRLGNQLGGSFRSLRRIDPMGRLRLRVEGGVLVHGRERFPLPGESGELRLTNTMVFAGVGPQVQLPRGPVRPYAHAFGGVHYLLTRADQRGPAGGAPVQLTTSFEDYAWAWGGGGGAYVPVRRGMMVDAGLTWRDGGEVTYSSFENGFGRTDTDLLVAHLGVTIEM